MNQLRNKDNFKSQEYYLKELERFNFCINRLSELKSQGKNLKQFYLNTNFYLKDKICIQYVLGEEIEIIRENVQKYIDNLSKRCCDGNSDLTYNEIVFALSWAYLLNLDVSHVLFIKENMLPEKYVDACLDLLRNTIFENKKSTDKTFCLEDKGYFGDCKKSETGLILVLNAPKEEQSLLFLEFLKKVKKKHYNKLIKYYESLTEDRYTYVGAYDYKLTAIAQIIGVEKEIIQDSIFIADELILE